MWDIWIWTVNVVCWFDSVCSNTDKAFSEEPPSMNQTHKCKTFDLEAFLYKNYSFQTNESCFSPFIPWVSEEKRLREFHAVCFCQHKSSLSTAKGSATGHEVFALALHSLRYSTRVIIRWAVRSWMLDPTLVLLCFIHQKSVNYKQRTSRVASKAWSVSGGDVPLLETNFSSSTNMCCCAMEKNEISFSKGTFWAL